MLRMVLKPRDLLNAAGLLTLTRLPLAILFPYIAHDRGWALVVYGLALLTDALDGTVARWTGTTSETGAFADGWADKIFHIQAAWSLALVGTIPGWWMLLWFSRELMQLLTVPWYIHRYVLGETPPVHAGWQGKATTLALGVSFVTVLLGLPSVAAASSWLCGLMGVLSGLVYLRRIQWGQWVEEDLRLR
jgi:cardiolipin synthase